jgi:hypothetical protein
MIKVVFRVTVPDELFQPLMQAIRDFDMKHDPNHEGKVHFESLTESDWPVERMAKVLKAVEPTPQHFVVKKCLCVTGCSVNGECPIHGDTTRSS